MKKIKFLLTFILASHFAMAQNSFLIAEEGMTWKEVRCNYWTGIITGHYFVDQFQIDGDTTFNGQSYKKLYKTFQVFKHAFLTNQSEDSLVLTDKSFFGGLRQDAQKVYVAASSYDVSMNEKLIFDFGATTNDTVTIWLGDLNIYEGFIVDSIYTITISDGSFRKKYTLKEKTIGTPLPFYWVEGIGSNYGLLSSYFVYTNDEISYLKCVKKGDALLYETQPDYYAECLVDPIQNCDTLIIGINETNGPLTIKVYPNPSSGNTTLKFDNLSNKQYQLGIYDTQGRCVKLIFGITNNEIKLDRDELYNGLYFIRLYSDNKVEFTGKIIFE